MKSPRTWLRDRRWRREQAPREGWASLLNEHGQPIATMPVVLHPTTAGNWCNAEAIAFTHLDSAGAPVSVTLVDADGKEYRAHLVDPIEGISQ